MLLAAFFLIFILNYLSNLDTNRTPQTHNTMIYMVSRSYPA